MTTMIEVRDLTVSFGEGADQVRAVDGISFDVEQLRSFGLVGESGSGKSLTALALVGLLPEAARVLRGSIRFDGAELLGRSDDELRQVRDRHRLPEVNRLEHRP